MRTPACTWLAALTLALPVLAQTKAQVQEPAAKQGTEKMWKIETTGLGG